MKEKEIINKKKNNEILSYEELSYFFNGYLNNEINDEEMTNMLKLICKYELTEQEIFDLTDIFIKSGEQLDLSSFKMTVDKHSTGGIGDKTTLILAPILASNDVKIAKMSGRALGYTGGTIDKLESIKNFNVNLDEKTFIKELKDINMVITSQTKDICPMDKKVYALRDVTNTTESISLIAVSIMSKKIASGANFILIDLKVGKGALIKNLKDAKKLAHIMKKIGQKYNKEVVCMLTKMDEPLGNNIGNSIEIMEVLDILDNKKENDLNELIIPMASIMISKAKKIDINKSKEEVIKSLNNKKAYNKFLEFVKYQNGNLNELKKDNNKQEVYSTKSGYIKSINSKLIGQTSMHLGAGRIKKDDKINYEAGIILNKKRGDYAKKGELLCTLYGKNKISIETILSAFKIGLLKPKKQSIIIEII